MHGSEADGRSTILLPSLLSVFASLTYLYRGGRKTKEEKKEKSEREVKSKKSNSNNSEYFTLIYMNDSDLLIIESHIRMAH